MDLPPDMQAFIALRGNYRSLSWQEEVQLKLSIDTTMRALHGSKTQGHTDDSDKWGIAQTAALLSETTGNVSRDLQLARALGDLEQLSTCTSKTVAFRTLKDLERTPAERRRRRRKEARVDNKRNKSRSDRSRGAREEGLRGHQRTQELNRSSRPHPPNRSRREE